MQYFADVLLPLSLGKPYTYAVTLGEYEFLKQYINSFTTLHDSAIVYKSYLLNEVKGTFKCFSRSKDLNPVQSTNKSE